MFQLLREKDGGGNSGGQRPAGDVEVLDETDEGDRIVCVACGQRITSSAARVDVGGSSEFTFVNPHCVVFQITTYGTAPGCLPQGQPSAEWSWFPGCSWQVQLCGGCGVHLGWLFRSEKQTFYGLIRERLTETDEP